VVVTGQYAAGSQDKAVQRIRVTDRKKIDAMNAQTLKDVLTNDMNIRLSQDNILGSGMSMQGISGQNVKILIDGVPVIGRQDGNIDLSQIMLNNIERIEIVEGPMSVNYGTDALAGTINLITKKTQRNLFETHLVTYYESIGTYNANLRTGFHKGRHTASLSGGRNFFDGWNNGEKVAVNFDAEPADSRRVQQWKPKEQYLGEGQYTYKTGNTTLSYKGGVFNEKITNLGMPRLPYGENAFDDYYSTYRVDNAFFVTSTLPRQRNIHFQVAYSDYKRIKNTFYNDLTTLEKELSTNDGDQDTS
jgi:outer membrane receptor for ferrienterochelin and colicins